MLRFLLLILTYSVLQEPCVSIFWNNIGYCQQQVSVQQQKPVLKSLPNDSNVKQYVDFEEQQLWQTVSICCPGYRSALFGICRPVCKQTCPINSFCAEPDKCLCSPGYEPTHQHLAHNHELSCHPTCIGGCPVHSHCVGHNRCACRAGYKDVSNFFFAPIRCQRLKKGKNY